MNAMTEKKNFQAWAQAVPEWPKAEPVWMTEIRQKAYERFRALGFPTRKQEAWKYIYLDSILNSAYVPASAPADSAEIKIPASLPKDQRLVFMNGFFQPGACPRLHVTAARPSK